MSDYTPTTEEVRERYAYNEWDVHDSEQVHRREEFDRWFSSEIAKAEYRGYEKGVTEASWGITEDE